MKTRDSKIFLILFCSAYLTSCASQTPPNPEPPALTPVTSPVPSYINTPGVSATPEPTKAGDVQELSSPTPEATPTPTPEPIQIPVPNLACMYVNYANSFPIVVTDSHRVEFHYDDTLTVTNNNGYTHEFSLSESVFVEGLDLTDQDLWYFCGAFEFDNVVYAHFDYLNNAEMTPSLLIKIDLHDMDMDASCCVLCYNPQKHFQSSFAVTKDFIYYTNTHTSNNTMTTDILRTDKNGENRITFYVGTPGETICYMTCDGNYLSYVITNSDEVHRLISTDLSNGKMQLLSNRLSQPDFLIGWNGYVFTSVQNSRLTYYDCTVARQKSIVYTTPDSSISAGYPLTDGENIYLPLISYSGNIGTALVPLNLEDENTSAQICFNDIYYYSVGMIDEYLFAENVNSLIVFDLKEQNVGQD